MVKQVRTILCLDVGTSSCKAVLFDEFGNIHAEGKGDYPTHRPAMGRVEQNPDELWDAVKTSMIHLHSATKGNEKIKAISISCQTSSYMLVGKNGDPLTKIVTWADSRAYQEAEEMKEAFSSEQMIEMLGIDLLISPVWSVPKLKWWFKHDPTLAETTKYIIQPKEWIIWKLTGLWKTDLTSVKSLVHQFNGEVATELLKWTGFPSHILPPIGEPYSIVGEILPAISTKLSLPTNTPVFLGWNDLNAGVLGATGLSERKVGFDITGTSEQVGMLEFSGNTFNPQPNSEINIVPFGDEHKMAYNVTFTGGQSFKWYVENIDQYHFNHEDGQANYEYDSVIDQIQTIEPGAETLLFLPFVNGERSPWQNPSARGVFFGLHSTHNRAHMARSVLEGVGYTIRAIINKFPSMPDEFVVVGGASKIDVWNQIKADIVGVPFSCIQTTEAGCLGVAILAAYGLGWYESIEEASGKMIKITKKFEPQINNKKMYDDEYERFVKLYHSLESFFE